MSYSFSLRAPDKEKLKKDVAAELDEVVASQPIHRLDRAVHQAAAEAMIDLVREPMMNEAVLVNVSGSCYSYTAEPTDLNGTQVNISVSFAPA